MCFPPGVMVDFELPAYVVREGDGEVVLVVRMVGGSNINVTVIATTENGTAVGMYVMYVSGM